MTKEKNINASKQDNQPQDKFADELKYIASAGIRAVVFAKQKLGGGVEVFLIGASETVLDVFKMTGIDRFLTIQDTFTE